MIVERLEFILNDPHSSKNEKKLAAFILSHRDILKRYGVREFSNEANVSPGTLLRFVQRLGFKGYAEFKALYCSEEQVYGDQPESKLNRIEYLSSKLLFETLTNTKEYNQLIDFRNLDKMITYISQSNRIFCYGEEPLADISLIFQWWMDDLNYEVDLITEKGPRIFNSLNDITRKDVAIITIPAGHADDYKDIARRLRNRNIPTLIIGHERDAYLFDRTQFFIPYPDNADTVNELTFTLYVYSLIEKTLRSYFSYPSLD